MVCREKNVSKIYYYNRPRRKERAPKRRAKNTRRKSKDTPQDCGGGEQSSIYTFYFATMLCVCYN